MRTILLLTAWAALLAGEPRQHFGAGAAFTIDDLPAGSLQDRLRALPRGASARALHRLHTLRLHRDDLPHLRVDGAGEVAVLCAALGEDVSVPAVAPMAADPGLRAPALHSRPGCPRIVVLDFDGFTGTWAGDGRSHPARPYDTDGDPTTFSAAEQAAIRRIWERVGEDFAPFDLDITTEDAPAGATCGRVVITHARDRDGNLNPGADRYGGLAYIGVFGWSSYPRYQPAWVYTSNLPSEAAVAETCAHEIGHNLGLGHDGHHGDAYCRGFGSGEASWGPIMGAPWYSNVTQWSVGAYAGATNSQDDLAVIAAAVGWGVDDHGDAPDTATRLEGGMQAGGVIGHRGDADALALRHAGGAIVLSVSPYRCATGTFGGDLDVRLELLDADGGVVAVDAPAQRTDARIACVLPAGDYTLRIAGDAGPWAPADASLGRWSLNGGGGTVAAISGEAGIRRDAPGAPRTSGGASGSEGGCGMGGIAGLLMACLGLGLRRRSA